jgi:inositol oxygenase
MSQPQPPNADAPLANLDDWDDDVRRRYSQAEGDPSASGTPTGVAQHQFRNYEEDTRSGVREFYRLNHRFQSVDFVRSQRQKYLPLRKRQMTVWEAIESLNAIIDTSDPDTEASQIEHAIQTAESIRRAGHPRWFVLVGLIHDLGKVLCLFGEPQWAVVGDTFPVGCAFSEKIVLPEFFRDNPDNDNPDYKTRCGIYREGCGLQEVLMSWGHDEYLYQVVRHRLPVEALYMIRYHSFYPAHREGEYGHLMNDQDRLMFEWVRKFNPFDLYTKTDERPDINRLLPYYQELVEEFLPGRLQW